MALDHPLWSKHANIIFISDKFIIGALKFIVHLLSTLYLSTAFSKKNTSEALNCFSKTSQLRRSRISQLGWDWPSVKVNNAEACLPMLRSNLTFFMSPRRTARWNFSSSRRASSTGTIPELLLGPGDGIVTVAHCLWLVYGQQKLIQNRTYNSCCRSSPIYTSDRSSCNLQAYACQITNQPWRSRHSHQSK